jgi:hypothetical protein
MKYIYLAIFFFIGFFSFSQVGIGTVSPASCAALDVSSSSKGFLPPRLSYDQKTAIASPVPGLIIWCTDCGASGELQVYYGTGWKSITSGNALGAVPGPPNNLNATMGNAQASIAFSPPTSNGGSAITNYTVTSSPGNFIGAGTVSPIVVTGLTNGTSYTFTVVATNLIGNSVASVTSNAVTPITVPEAPTSPFATFGNAQASVAFSTPMSNGGSAITSYTVTSSPGGLIATGALSPLVVNGLTNGTAYSFTVMATNAAGNSEASVISNVVTPYTTPSVPLSPTAVAGNAQASITFSPPTSNGGSTITNYTVTSTPDNFTGTGTVSPIVVTGLTPGTSYTFEVVATNAAGNSLISSASASIIPYVSAICDGTQPTTIVEITSSTGKVWMDRNLGASRAAISSTDFMAYGCLFQWGRGNDGHGSINWTSATTGAPVNGSTATSSATDTPGDALFITNVNGDWRSTPNINLWQGVNGVNNPCPTGYRVATEIEFNNERLTWISQNPDGAFASLLKLPVGGYRDKGSALLRYNGQCGRYLASTTISSVSRGLGFNNGSMPSSPNTAGIYSLYRADAESIRCIKN